MTAISCAHQTAELMSDMLSFSDIEPVFENIWDEKPSEIFRQFAQIQTTSYVAELLIGSKQGRYGANDNLASVIKAVDAQRDISESGILMEMALVEAGFSGAPDGPLSKKEKEKRRIAALTDHYTEDGYAYMDKCASYLKPISDLIANTPAQAEAFEADIERRVEAYVDKPKSSIAGALRLAGVRKD